MTAAAFLAAVPGFAQAPGKSAAELEQIERSLESARSQAGRLEAELHSVAEEQAELKRKLIDSAARIQTREDQITQGENRLDELAEEDAILRSQLGERRSAMSEMLAALQKLEREPPPVLAVRPGDAVAAIRSAMLLASVVPQVRAEADALSRTLRKLASLREETVEQQRQLTLNRTQLTREHQVIERLLEVKSQHVASTAKERDEVRQRAEALAGEASSLKELLASLEQERRRDEAREEALFAAREQAEQAPGGPTEASPPAAESVPSAEERRLAMARPDRLRPAVAFAQAVGALSLPARGTVLRHFGDDDGYGGSTKGMSIETRPTAQVIAPNGGWVVYAGEFRGYGELLILDGGDGYHVLLAGMSRIDVSLGQFVLAGEPIGRMGEHAAESAAIGVTSEQDRPVLYVEFRKDGISIDPQPWWAVANMKARG
jgi:septal ring factor EnvC (AmiA/AmiB activator)